LAIVFLRGISSIGNCISDRVEDAIDHPERAVLCERIGYPILMRIVIALVIAYLALLFVMALVMDAYLGAMVLWLAYLLAKLSYSFGPRLKPKKFSATILLGAVSSGMFFVGWIGNGLHDLTIGVATAILLWAMGASLAGSKDAPDLAGDARIGYRSVYRDLMDSSRPLRRAVGIVSRPYLVAVVFALVIVLTGGPGLSLLWCLTVYPMSIMFAVLLVRARSDTERNLVREFGYLYWIVFMDVVLVATVPTSTVALVGLGAIAWYLLASRVAHPDPVPYRLRDLRDARSALIRV
jgi:4-hydroxybenzoate polyprenyltransferase